MLHHIVLLSNRLPISSCCSLPKDRFLHNTHLSATESTTRMLFIWLACVKHAANIHLELGHHLILAYCNLIQKFHPIEQVYQFSWDNFKCSLWDLTQHFTTRANDNHAPPMSALSRAFFSFKKISRKFEACQALVRVFMLHRIKPHAPSFVQVLGQFLWIPFLWMYSPSGIFNVLATTLLYK